MSNCSCVSYDNDYGPSCFKAITRKARKIHKCNECGEVILPGCEYKYESGVWDGTPDSYKTCLDCMSVRDEFFCEGWTYGDLWCGFDEHVSHVDGDIPEDNINNLSPKAKGKVLGIIDDYWEDMES